MQSPTMEMDHEPPPTLRAMSVFEEGDSISFAFYDEESSTITLETCKSFGHDTDIVVQSVRVGLPEPSIVVVPGKIAGNGPLLALIVEKYGDRQMPRAQASEGDGPPPALSYKVLNSTAFDLRSSTAAITKQLSVKALSREQAREELRHNAVSFPSPPRASSGPERNSFAGTSFHSLSTVVDFDAPTEVRALGGLMSYLQSTVFQLEQDQLVSVVSINPSSTASHLRVTPAALKSLHVFSDERHPLITKGHGASKEGFSLFSLLNRCYSKVGSKCLRQWMLRPLTSVEQIEKRQAGVELFSKPDMAQPVAEVRKLLSAVTDVPSVLMRMHKCLAKPLDFISLKRSMDAGIQVLAVLHGAKAVAAHDPAHASFLEGATAPAYAGALATVAKRIEETVDEELTRELNRVCIRDGFSEDLDNAKQRFDNLDDLLSRVGTSISNRFPQIASLQVIFLPQVGFLVSVDSSIYVDAPEFVFSFSNEWSNYYKCEEMYTLDDQEGDLDALINDTEALIASELEDDILDYDLQLRTTFQALAGLDCVMAFSSVATEMNFVRPLVVDDAERTILVEKGRSPLQELLTDHRYIPNDVQLTSASPIGMITGPTYSGKSCYMSMVGVLVYLAQIGSFVPADKAKFSVVDKILVRIASVETCSVPQSSFQIDLTQMGHILRQVSAQKHKEVEQKQKQQHRRVTSYTPTTFSQPRSLLSSSTSSARALLPPRECPC